MRISINLPTVDLEALNVALEGLVRANVAEMGVAGLHALPSILDGGVRYQRELPGREEWRTRSLVLASGVGDCEDLSAALAAELRAAGVPARAVIRRARGGVGYHAVVRLGQRELDPSRWLGM